MTERIPDDDLLADLRRVADKLDKSPSKNEYNEHGEYSAQTLMGRFGSWNDAKEAVGLETYGFGVGHGGGREPQNIQWLRKHGPAPASRLPTQSVFSISDREHGMRRLKLVGKPKGSGTSDSQGGANTTIYYLPEHDPERIVRVFLMQNPHLIENLSYQGLIQRFGQAGDDVQDAARTVLDETDIRRRDAESYGKGGKDPDNPTFGELYGGRPVSDAE